ncbi:hypothetical protein EDB92DRAFT_1173570 [Lactarius akahatsu]|uniref:Uncharacterized protein n=1 Tax=Lactarius akahatsu TaxID=416441 RepID=A0AAD4LQ87_9AGAM|nr:hypothetical protein EDB92DRAFT_1173570 [Lactarius akahatsu]
MLEHLPPGVRCTHQHPPQAASAPYFMGHAGPSSVNYGSSSAQLAFISRRDPARNQRPQSPLFAAHIDGPQVQSHLYRGSQHVAYSLPRPPMFAPGGNPFGHQTPGMITATPPRPWNHHQNRSRGLYSPYPLPRRQEVGYQRDDLHSQTFQQFEVPGWPVFMTNNLGSISPQSLNWDGQAIALPHGSHVNEVGALFHLSQSRFPVIFTSSFISYSYGTGSSDANQERYGPSTRNHPAWVFHRNTTSRRSRLGHRSPAGRISVYDGDLPGSLMCTCELRPPAGTGTACPQAPTALHLLSAPRLQLEGQPPLLPYGSLQKATPRG